MFTQKTVVEMDVKRSRKDKPVNEQIYWSKRQRKIWVGTLFLGSVMSYVTRVAGPVTVVAMGQDLKWDKTVAVSIKLLYKTVFIIRFYLVYLLWLLCYLQLFLKC